MRARHARQGFLLITTLMVVSGLLMLSAVSLTRSATDLLVTNRFVASQQAFALAEAGVDAAIKEFHTGGLFASADGWSSPEDGVDTYTADVPLAIGTATVMVRNALTATPTILATAHLAVVPSISAQLEVTGSRADGLTGPYGIFAQTLSIDTTGPVYVDSYDSHILGGYGGSNVGYEGNLGVNGPRRYPGDPDFDPPELDVTGFDSYLTLHGVVRAPASTTQSFSPLDQCNQGSGVHPCDSPDVQHVPVRTLPPIEIPAELTDPAQTPCDPPTTVGNGQTLPISGDRCFQSLTVNSGGTLVLELGARLYLTGDGSDDNIFEVFGNPAALGPARVIAKGNNQLFAERGAFYVSGWGGLITESQRPEDLQIRLRGTTPAWTEHSLVQTEPIYGLFYSEAGGLMMGGQAVSLVPLDIYGAIISGNHSVITTWQLAGLDSVRVHRDVQLANLSLSGGPNRSFRILSWRAL